MKRLLPLLLLFISTPAFALEENSLGNNWCGDLAFLRKFEVVFDGIMVKDIDLKEDISPSGEKVISSNYTIINKNKAQTSVQFVIAAFDKDEKTNFVSIEGQELRKIEPMATIKAKGKIISFAKNLNLDASYCIALKATTITPRP